MVKNKVLFDKNGYKEFSSRHSAHKWGLENYREWIDRIQRELPQSEDKSLGLIQSYISAEHDGGVADLLFKYTGSNNLKYNSLLYNGIIANDYDEDEIEELQKEQEEMHKEINIIDTELHKFETPENIVVYRFTRKEWFTNLFANGKCKNWESIVFKGLSSTTLFAESMLEYIKQRHYNCILRLYLPKGTKGAYIWQHDGLHEYEFLLPTNSAFRLIKKDIWTRELMSLYECILVEQ